MSKRPTYRQLFNRLKGLGYTERTVDLNGVTQHVFVHKDIDTATIILPKRPLSQHADPMHLWTVQTVLKNHGVIPNGQEAVVS